MRVEKMFSYTYSPRENQEVLSIRQKYLPREETKLEELKRLDRTVQSSGTMESLCVGIGSCLVFGLGMCLAMGVIGQMSWLGVVLGLVGMAGMILAYPVCRRLYNKAKEQYAPRILALSEELTAQSGTN